MTNKVRAGLQPQQGTGKQRGITLYRSQSIECTDRKEERGQVKCTGDLPSWLFLASAWMPLLYFLPWTERAGDRARGSLQCLSGEGRGSGQCQDKNHSEPGF